MMKRQNVRKALVIISFLLFPISVFYFSPYIIVHGSLAGIVAGSFIMFSIQFVLSLFLGRSLCGYVCPVGGLQEYLMLVNNKISNGGENNFIKHCLWVPWILAIIILFIRAGGITKVDFFFMITDSGSLDGPFSLNEPYTYAVYYGVIFIITILSLIFGKRAFCHCVCWMAPFMIIGTKLSNWLKIPNLHLDSNKAKCIGCNKCSEKCPMSLDVKNMVENNKMVNSECILCGECIDICPKKAIHYCSGKKET